MAKTLCLGHYNNEVHTVKAPQYCIKTSLKNSWTVPLENFLLFQNVMPLCRQKLWQEAEAVFGPSIHQFHSDHDISGTPWENFLAQTSHLLRGWTDYIFLRNVLREYLQILQKCLTQRWTDLILVIKSQRCCELVPVPFFSSAICQEHLEGISYIWQKTST